MSNLHENPDQVRNLAKKTDYLCVPSHLTIL